MPWGTTVNEEANSQSRSTLSPSGEAMQILDDLDNLLDNDGAEDGEEDRANTTISIATPENGQEMEEPKFSADNKHQQEKEEKVVVKRRTMEITFSHVRLMHTNYKMFYEQFKDEDLPPPEPPVDYDDVPRVKYHPQERSPNKDDQAVKGNK